MSLNYVLSQIFVLIAVIFQGMIYLNKDKKKIMVFCIMYACFYGLQYLLLEAMTGFTMNSVNIVRNFWFYDNVKKNKNNSIYMLLTILFLITLMTMFTYTNIYSLMPVVAAILMTYSLWQKNLKIYRFLSLPISILWLTYNIYCNSIFGIVAEIVLLIFELLAIYKYDIKKIVVEA
ncbi:MAG: YgjV family protein [Tenericutes bacterium]|jgi:hypothetical protein|nr:YgjV family protein [Mycoplasmatota bacterium]